MAELTKDELEICRKLKEEHEDIGVFKTRDDRLIVVRKCNDGERTRVIEKMHRKQDAAGLKELAISATVYPERDEAKDIFKKYPALCDKVGNKSYELAGGDVEELGNF